MSENCTHDCGSCSADCASRTADFRAEQNQHSNVKKVIGIVSGKGGVGKSLVTSLLAVTARRRGYETAILDADITGPSIPKAFNVHEQLMGTDDGVIPAQTKTGIRLVSLNLLLENETDPVVWRGPIIAGTVKQFWTDVMWGDVDFMFVDMPPGTGDVPLTVFQSLPVDGVILVTSPQELVGMIVKKAARMAEMMNVPVLGLVENMSGFQCDQCGKVHDIFGASHAEAVAKELGIPVCARLPINPKLAAACDKGMVELFEGDWLEKIADAICGEDK
ncbi:MAG TPA: Mrp/NBP35 family ATP-binding protein [Candidatus Pullichristensenella stercorigallinarum]|uniref:Iron-sulfur cluster carrier protein n=1 Tax=Candidatus Pullichristensenella stercorigallinarum TaxID=2840909 RepID=A0A9D0ZNX2_9FIRM|nr:Mrp/NBP35 family ATP-binding protein [Candidatus Pullichristensenella stercorigallinarum]